MSKVMISLPDDLLARMKAMIPTRQRSQIFRQLLENEISKREKDLYQRALALENNEAINQDLKDLDNFINEGLDEL